MIFEPKACKVESIRKYTEDIRLLKVRTNMKIMPGQFFEVSVLGQGECPLASCSYDEKYSDILLRKVGNVTASIFRLEKGQEIYIRGPYGKGYEIEKLRGKDIVLVAGGTGIAPVTSLIEYITKNRKDFGRITIFFAFRDEEHILLMERMKKWQKNFELHLCLDKKGNKIKSEVGRVSDIIEKYKPKAENSSVVLCGPEPMMEEVTKKLNLFGFEDNKIYWNMERRMECAIGSCGRCLLGDLYVCKDGPVFSYDKIKEKIQNEKK